MAKVAFLGLGVMGYPMARHLSQKGHEVTVYNRWTVRQGKVTRVRGHLNRSEALAAASAADED